MAPWGTPARMGARFENSEPRTECKNIIRAGYPYGYMTFLEYIIIYYTHIKTFFFLAKINLIYCLTIVLIPISKINCFNPNIIS